jgi:hypothetical protein
VQINIVLSKLGELAMLMALTPGFYFPHSLAVDYY